MNFYETMSLLHTFTVTPTSSKLPELTICYLDVLRPSTVEPHMPVKRLDGSIRYFWKASNASARTVSLPAR